MNCQRRRARAVIMTLGLSGIGMLTLALCVTRAGKSHGLDMSKDVLKEDVTLSTGYTQTTIPGREAVYTHIITNTGTETDTHSLVPSSLTEWSPSLFDAVHSVTDTPSLQLAPGGTATFGFSATVPGDVLSGTVAHVSIRATSSASPAVNATLTDTIIAYRVPGVVLSRGQSRSARPGQHVTITHWITNTGPCTDLFLVRARSQTGWVVQLVEEHVATETLQITLGELDTYRLVLDVAIPLGLPSGTVDHIFMTASSLSSDVVASTVSDTVTVQSNEAYTALLPLVTRMRPPSVQLGADFGLMIRISDVITYDLPLVKAMGADWIRVPLVWYDVEESPGAYDWTEYDRVFARLRDLGFRAVVVVHAAPLWAAEESCGPISDTVALENFLDRALTRYGDVTDVWEFINEPDGKAPQPEYPEGAMGCWGPHPAEYARQLGIFHAKVKSFDPETLVAFGGLAYDAWDRFERSFFSRTLQAGAGPFFDIANLHYYPINVKEFPTMAHKVNEIRETMARNGVHNKRIWITETGMWVNLAGSVEKQCDFIVKEFTRGFGAGADNVFWFDPREHYVGEGVHRWLISEDHEPINGYRTFQHYSGKLEGLHCEGAYQGVPESVEAYEFSGPYRSLYILWSKTTTQTVTMPASGEALLTDRDGDTAKTLHAQNGKVSFDLGVQPMFLELVEDGGPDQ